MNAQAMHLSVAMIAQRHKVADLALSPRLAVSPMMSMEPAAGLAQDTAAMIAKEYSGP